MTTAARGLLVGWVVVAVAAAQQDDASALRCRELAAAQDAGAFPIAAAVAALADPDEAIARTAAAIVRHEWVELPEALFAALDREPRAAHALLRELAVAPRPAAAAWALQRAAEAVGRSPDERCLALAARGKPLAAGEVELMLRTLVEGQAGDGWQAALAVVPAPLADATLGRVHAALQRGQIDVERAGPWLDRLSPAGVRRLLALVLTLPDEVALPLCVRLHEAAPELVLERVGDALDGPGPVAAVWVGFAGPCLDRPQRIRRIEALLADASVPAATQTRALLALLDARVVTEAMLDQVDGAAAGGLPLVEHVLDVAIDRIPASRLCRWLDGEFAAPTARALARRAVLEPELQRVLVARLREAGVAEGVFGEAAASALVAHGSAESLQQVWPLLRASRNWAAFVDGLGRRREPFVPELLLAELQAPAPDVDPDVRRAQLDAVALALVACGDRRELQRLVAAAPRAAPGVVRRCSHYARPLAAPFALSLLDAVPMASDADTAAEMVAWAATAVGDAAVRDRLLGLWRAEAPTLEAAERRDVALRALAASDHRGELVRDLRTALGKGPIPDDLEPLPYALLASMPTPPAADDLSLCTDLVLLAPRTDAEREAAAAKRWPDGSFGFPLVAAVAERLRAVTPDAAARAFAAASEAALADPRHTAISRSRLLVLWRELAVVPDVQRAVGVATAGLALAVGDPGADTAGPAHWFAMHEAGGRGDFAAARRHAERARGLLLRLPEQRRLARIFLGERDPGAGADPWAALAAMPHVFAHRDALARGDAAAASRSAALVCEFAGHDVSTLATVSTTPPERAR